MNINTKRMMGTLLILAAAFLGGCASNGNHVKNVIGDEAVLAEVNFRHDKITTRDSSVESPIKNVNVYQLAFTDPKSKSLIQVPDGRGSTLPVIRFWDIDTTEPIMKSALPGMLTAATGGIVQGEYAKSAIREQGRLCKDGKCQGGPVVNVSATAGSQSASQVAVEANSTSGSPVCTSSKPCLSGD
jgi:hypothetical protein